MFLEHDATFTKVDANPAGVICRWTTDFTEDLRGQTARLMNTILEREDTIGYPAPLPFDEAMGIMNETAENAINGSVYLLLFMENTRNVVGHLLLTRSSLPNCRHIAEISQTFIHPLRRNPGVIRKGLRAVIEKSEESGIEVLKLDVRANSRIARLWQALGFSVIGEMQDYARVNGEVYSGLLMSQHVNVIRDRLSRYE